MLALYFHRRGRRIDKMANDGIAFQAIGAIDQILPHKIFREGEGCEHSMFGDLPTFDVLDVPADDPPNIRDVDPRRITGQLPANSGIERSKSWAST